MTRKRRKAISHILTKGKSKRNKSTNKFINLKKAWQKKKNIGSDKRRNSSER